MSYSIEGNSEGEYSECVCTVNTEKKQLSPAIIFWSDNTFHRWLSNMEKSTKSSILSSLSGVKEDLSMISSLKLVNHQSDSLQYI